MTIRAGKRQFTLFLMITLVILAAVGCRLRATYNVPPGKHLLKRNDLEVDGDKVDKSKMEEVIRQQPNLSTGKIKWRLISYNLVDSSKVERKRARIYQTLRRKNQKRIEKQERVNNRRREKAIRKGRDTYFYKTVKLKDTINPRLSIVERMKYKFGEAPVIVDTVLFRKSKEQLSIYMHKKGYYYDTVTGYLDTVKSNKIVPHFHVITGPRYYIDSLYIISGNSVVTNTFRKYISREPDDSPLNTPFNQFLDTTYKKPLKVPFDSDELNTYRDKLARYMRNEALYGFSPAHIEFVADTSRATMTVKLGIVFTDRMMKSTEFADSLVPVKHRITSISGVYFHVSDTTLFKGNFRKYIVEELHLELKKDNFVQTVDTLHYAKLVKKVRDPESDQKGMFKDYLKSESHTTVFGTPKDSVILNPFRMATFLYNGELFVQPGLVEAQNYLEYTNVYKEYYVDRSYSRLLQLGLFSLVKPVLVETAPGTIEVHYYLVPAEKQSFGFEPRGTTSNGYLGVSASVNYANKNLFKSGCITTLSLSGGFESQPRIFAGQEEEKTIKEGSSFNTFEIGPTLKFDLPGLFPVNIAKMSKRVRPRTVLSAAYNYQKRSDFSRGVFQLNYLWRFYVGKTQIVSIGLPTTSVIKFVAMNKTIGFQARIDSLHDLFLANAYSDQLIWEDLKLAYDYDNRDYDKKRPNLRITFNATFDLAGFTLSAFQKRQEKDSLGRYQLLGVAYSQFGLVDTKFVIYYNLTKHKVLAFRTLAGVGVPMGNTRTSLPYDYSFFAGGSNDNRGWRARTLGPGSYKYYLDKDRTATQIGDIRLGASVELRLSSGGLLNHAFFFDVGNVWTMNKDINRLGGQFSKNWYKELGLAAGYGIRLDFNFFVIRLDIGFPLTNPALPQGAKWVFQSRKPYYDEGFAKYGSGYLEEKSFPKRPFFPVLQIGIGYPF